jgi:RNA polymerase sigma factor (TIGR02999 family)
MSRSPNEITQLLQDWRNGDQSAIQKLIPLVHGELRGIAHKYMKQEKPGHTWQTTALLNEAYLRLVGQKDLQFESRAHFFALAAQVMRHLLVDYARASRSAKRGGGVTHVSLDETAVLSDEGAADMVELNEALNKLSQLDPRKCQIVELRYFAGLNVEETSEVLGISPITVKREWSRAKAWLYRELGG